MTGDAIGPELERQVEAIFRYDAGDPRFCPARAADLETSTMRLRTSQAYANECADPVFAGGADVTPAHVERELGNIKPGKVPHPGDGIEPEALKYGGAGLCRTLAVLFTLILRTGAVPKQWLIGAMRCVYKKNCPTVFTNYRGVVPTSHLGKLFERVVDAGRGVPSAVRSLWF